MAVKTLILKAIRLGPLSIGAIAIAVMVLGGYLQIGENARAAQGVAGGIAGMTTFGFLSKIAGVLGLIALVKFVLSSGGGKDDDADSGAPDVPPRPKPAAHIVDVQPQPATPTMSYAHSEAEDFDAIEDQPRRGFGFRKALIFLIGGAFAVMLASVVWDMLQDTSGAERPTTQVSIPTAQERVAQTVADTIVPDANPNREWTDIDVTPVIEWGVAKFYLAASGDTDAQKLLGMIVGGVLFALFLIRFFFRLRRAMQSKTTARIGSMGIN